MSKFKTNTVLAGAVALAISGGTAFAAGAPLGVGSGMPGGGNFSIDDAGFVATNLNATECPTGTTCTAMTGSDGTMLLREINDGSTRVVQQIVADLGGSQGDFVLESNITTDGLLDNNASKVILDDAANDFFSTQAFYRGDTFDGATGNFNIAVEVHQDVGNGFQTFDMETEAAPNQNANGNIANRSGGWFRIAQNAGQRAGEFLHVAMGGASYTPIGGTLGIDGNEITYDAGDTISATWIGQQMWNGGPQEPGDIILEPGQDQPSDFRSVDQAQFGLLVYRSGASAQSTLSPITGNSGGDGTFNDPMFSQTEADGVDIQEVRGFTLHADQNSNDYLNINHGSFTGGDDLLSNWDDGVFGTAPEGPGGGGFTNTP